MTGGAHDELTDLLNFNSYHSVYYVPFSSIVDSLNDTLIVYNEQDGYYEFSENVEENNDYNKAIEQFTNALEVNVESGKAHYQLGLANYRLGSDDSKNYENAVENFLNSLSTVFIVFYMVTIFHFRY